MTHRHRSGEKNWAIAFVAVSHSYIAGVVTSRGVSQSHAQIGTDVCADVENSYNMVIDSLSITRPVSADKVDTDCLEGLTDAALDSRAKCKLYEYLNDERETSNGAHSYSVDKRTSVGSYSLAV
jgi:hypothetical protein